MPDTQRDNTAKLETIFIGGMPFEKADVLAMPDGQAVWDKGQAEKTAIKARDMIRTAIKKEVGDPQSLLGTTADGAQLTVAALLVDIVALDQSKTFAEYKAARLSLMSELIGTDHATGKAVNVAGLAKSLLAKIQSGEVTLTAVIKGVPAVLTEVMDRATKVVAILSGAAK